MKQRFSTLDVFAAMAELQPRLLGMRVANIYDLNPRTYLIKFARGEEKVFLLIESGIRIHSTEYTREKSNTPSGFAMKLRKHLRTRRLTSARQLGVDRVVDLEFGGGSEYAFHLICEFYASGNIILTDKDYKILSLLRVVQPEESVRFAVNEVYPTSLLKVSLTLPTEERLRECLRTAGPNDVLAKVLGANFDYGASLIDHSIRRAGLTADLKVAERLDTSEGSPQLAALLEALVATEALFHATTPFPGYISVKVTPKVGGGDALETFEDFQPLLLEQSRALKTIEFPSFDRACDEYFSQFESQRADLKMQAQETQALKKIEAVRKDHESRVRNLRASQTSNVHKAELIQAHLKLVDDAINVVRVALANAMQWGALRDLIKEQRALGNPVARAIDRLKLETNQITLLLEETVEGEDDEYNSDEDFSDEEASAVGKKRARVAVDVDLALSAHANAREYFTVKKANAAKEQKTLNASEMAYKSAEKKITREMKQVQIAKTINRMRKPMWFEKFLWFISSENYLILAGRDMQQNENLVKRHLRKGDAYVHADIHGAASVIVKNPNGQPISPVTLAQAGSFAVCLSSAWDSKVAIAAWWVEHHQVSKTAPTGEYLTTGSFMVRGKKNFLPPVQLIMGFGIMFRVDESCVAAHIHERRPRLEAGDAADEEPTPTQEDEEVAPEGGDDADGDDDDKADTPVAAAADVDADNDSEDEAAFPDTSVQSAFESSLRTPAAPAAADEYDGADSDDSSDEGKRETTGAKHMSAAERRLQKKAAASSVSVEELRAQRESRPKPTPSPKQEAPAPAPSARGKRGKLKKMKEKYAEQDDEDRELAMKLLAPVKAKPAPVAKTVPARMQQQNQKKGGKQQQQQRAKAKEAEDAASPAVAQDEQADAPEAVEETTAEEKEEIKRLLEEENITVLDEEEATSLTFIDALTGQPNEHDILTYAVPVCAPYAAVTNFKYKVKLTPGTLKKGKASKTALSLFARVQDALPREKELIKGIPEADLMTQMLGKVKLMAPNLQQSRK